MKLFRWGAQSRNVGKGRSQPTHLAKNASARLDVDDEALNPLVGSLLEFWHENRLDTGLPDRNAFDPARMTDWLGYISVYEYVPAKDDFRNRLEGSYVADLTGENWTGQCASAVDAKFGGRFLTELQEIRRTRMPSVDLIQVFQNDYGMAIRAMLPVSSTSTGEADQIFVAIFANGFRPPNGP